jgi:uncharacterized protein
MIKSRRIPNNKDELIEKIREALDKYPNVVFAYVFGGLARGSLSPLADVDVAVYLADESYVMEEKLTLLGSLMDTLGTDEIDLVLLNMAPLPLKARVLRNKEILVDRRPYLRHAFESLVLREYFDFSMKEEAILKRRFSLG